MSAAAGATVAKSLTAALQRSRSNIGLRAERDADLDFLRGLYARVRAQELAPVAWTVAQKRSFTDAQFDLQHSHYREHYPGAEFLVIEHDGVPIGRLYVCVFPREIRLMDIAIVESRRNAGIGTHLLHALLDTADAGGYSVTLHVEPENPAQRLYRRLGFSHIESRGVYDFLGRPARAAAIAESS